MTSPPVLSLPLALDTLLMKVIQVNGVDVPIRRRLNFIGTVTWEDDPDNDSTDVELSGGEGAGATTLEASFTQPAVGATVNPLVLASGGYSVGVDVQIPGGGYYQVTAVPDGTHLTLKNLGAAVNAAPGATVTSGGLITWSGPPNLLVQINEALVTQRGAIDFDGFGYTDDAANNRIILNPGLGALGSPGSTITTSYNVLVADRWKLFDATSGAIAFTLPGPGAETSATVGLTREFSHIAGNGSGGVFATFSGNGAQVSLLDGTFGTSSIVSLRTPGITTRIRWDGTVYRCVN